ncbi:nucleoside triphosphate pyrophosphohydrolase [Alkalihalobacillus sp. AL-G]|uniref:nucleoside triphosphate pyrophosphohydrolase n=1 Tax=Alkalihalobacillus sp. AL-G TaxID=2926399 RepID=UPI00272D580E|nr:nucleoside triphosphate pyrophosphohydrolase [Alkalihalobacillus sp. AL-G]WLD94759.1 nucleoside triphosphate pyrophosphohydrolase [Alkalihalobacillus sp. AL-G]
MPEYRKLVRDKIPEIIKQSGDTFRTKVLRSEEYISELQKKAYEELDEVCASDTNEETLEELADLLEVVHALTTANGFRIEQLEEKRVEKAEKRGGFSERIFLIDVAE